MVLVGAHALLHLARQQHVKIKIQVVICINFKVVIPSFYSQELYNHLAISFNSNNFFAGSLIAIGGFIWAI
jgi:hypothetical protein